MKDNPIDVDKITQNPHNIPYAHNISSAEIKPLDETKLKNRQMLAMEQQTNMQLEQISQQIKLLLESAQKIKKRKDVSEKIYQSEIRFEPLVNHIYYLYKRDNGNYLLSLISPNEWGQSKITFSYESTIRLLADYTWEILD